MKRFIWSGVAALVLLMVASLAHAAWLPLEDVPWERSNTTDGLYAKKFVTTGASAKVDTSFTFDLTICTPSTTTGDSINAVGTLGAPSRSVTLSDTTLIAKLVIYADSSTASTQAWGSPSLVLQGRWGAYGSWATVQTIAPKSTDAAKFTVFPILNLPSLNDFGIEYAQQSWWVGPQFRFILTWGTGNVNTARIALLRHVGSD
jgi:hypothetical protein